MLNILRPAARWAAGLTLETMGDEAVHHAKRAIVDWFAAVVPGGVMPPARILREALVNEHEHGRASLLPGGASVPVRVAALINGTAAHSAEVDDIFRDGIYHPGAPTIAAALAAAQGYGASGADLLRAVTIGFEISTRIAVRVQPAHYRFWHTTGTVGTMGAAAAAAAILGADEEGFLHSIATATTIAAGLQQAFRSDAMSKPLHAGHAADAGTMAAMAAVRGFTGAPDILDGAAGFGAAMSDGPDWNGIFDDLGEVWNMTQMTFKNHACCGHTFAAIDGALELLPQFDGRLEDIEAVEIETYGTALKVAGIREPSTAFEAQFSLPYTVAAALRLGSVRLAAFEDTNLQDERVRSLMRRVQLSVDPALDASFPGQRGARVRVRLTDGASFECFRPTRTGDPDAPLTDGQLSNKFMELVGPHLAPEVTERLLGALWELERKADITDLIPK